MRPNMIFSKTGRARRVEQHLDGQGHVTAVHPATGVSEIIVPSPRTRLFRDMLGRNFIAVLLTAPAPGTRAHRHGEHRRARIVDGIVAVEEASGPSPDSRRREDQDCRRAVAFENTPIAAHGATGISNFRTRPPRARCTSTAPRRRAAQQLSLHDPQCGEVRVTATCASCDVRAVGNFWDTYAGASACPRRDLHLEQLLVNRTSGETAHRHAHDEQPAGRRGAPRR